MAVQYTTVQYSNPYDEQVRVRRRPDVRAARRAGERDVHDQPGDEGPGQVSCDWWISYSGNTEL